MDALTMCFIIKKPRTSSDAEVYDCRALRAAFLRPRAVVDTAILLSDGYETKPLPGPDSLLITHATAASGVMVPLLPSIPS